MPEDDGQRLDVTAEHPPAWAVRDAAQVPAAVVEDGGRLPWRRRVETPPVVRFTDRYFAGTLDLRAREFPYLLEFVRCRFEQPPDLRQAKIAGCEFDGCWLPGLAARNLRSDNDFTLRDCTVRGAEVDLTDADLGGTLTLSGSTLDNPDGPALHANRLVLAGAVYATGLHAVGVVNMSGLRSGGNVNFRGAMLHGTGTWAIDARGMRVAGSLLCGSDSATGRFSARGALLLTGAQLEGDLLLRTADLRAPEHEVSEDDPRYDPSATLVADRMRIGGNAILDRGMCSDGTLRMVNAYVGGGLSLDRAAVNVSRGEAPPLDRRALRLDGIEIAGDLRGWQSRFAGQLRLVDVTVRGSVLLDRSRLHNPVSDVVHARRIVVGGNLDCRNSTIAGSVLLQGATIGANLDLRATELSAPGSYRRDRTPKPSLNIRTASIGRDLTCASDADRPFTATGEIRMHRASVVREADFHGAELGDGQVGTALNALGANIQDLDVRLGRPPRGRINLRHARCAALADNDGFWTGEAGIDLEDFRYDALAEPVPLREDGEVERRLGWLRGALRGEYKPGPYDQLAAMFRASGNEEHASTVLIRKQEDRYRALARGYRRLGPGVRFWSLVQRLMVGYGYRPTRALVWLLGLLVFGSLWFGLLGDDCGDRSGLVPVGPRCPVNVEDTGLVWNPFLYTMDLLVPIVDFGNKWRWHMAGADQWISATLTAMGWILATTVAAGVTRTLRASDSGGSART